MIPHTDETPVASPTGLATSERRWLIGGVLALAILSAAFWVTNGAAVFLELASAAWA